MIWLVVVMLLILLAAGAVVMYVAYPYRNEEVPRARWLGKAMRKGARAVPRGEMTARGGARRRASS